MRHYPRYNRGRLDRDRMVVGFTTTCVHWFPPPIKLTATILKYC